uniref:Aftiphilin-like n=1 Tax=Phallusia mammillata TaxID=59560 RepID=A0A6F9D595_9ASCI|nr:aftiphilin-like [Phallusia mammillata]
MTDHIFPIISTTPPPLDFDDEEDDFTDFAAAQNHWVTETSEDFTDCPLPEVRDSPLDSPVKIAHFKNGEDTFKNDHQNETILFPEPGNYTQAPGLFFNDHKPPKTDNHITEPIANSAKNGIVPPLEKSDFSDLTSFQNNFDESVESENNLQENCGMPQNEEFGLKQTNTESNVSNGTQSSSGSEYEESQPDLPESEQKEGPVIETNKFNESSDETNYEHNTTEQDLKNDSDIVKTDSSNTELSEKFYSANDLSDMAMKTTNANENYKTDIPTEVESMTKLDEEPQVVLPCENEGITLDLSNRINSSKSQSSEENNESVTLHHNSESDDEDEFADFASFDKPSSTANVDTTASGSNNISFSAFTLPEPLKTKVPEVNNASCEFAAFEDQEFPSATEVPLENEQQGFAEFSESSFQQSAFTTFEASTSSQKEDDSDFGDFDDFQTSTTPSNNADDDFGDFSSTTKPDPFQPTSIQAPYQHPSVNFGKWFSFSTPDIVEDEITSIQKQVEDDLLEVFHSENVDTESGQKLSHRASYLWDLLEDIDNAIALKFVWNNSSHHQHLLSSLGIKTQNILFGRTSKPYYVPNYYAAGLGMLEPGKEIIKPMSAAEKITAVSPKEKNMPDDDKAWAVETERNGVVSGAHACSEGHQSVGAITNGSAATGIIDASSLNLDMLNSIVKSQNSATSKSEQDKIDPELLELAMEVTPDQTSTKKADPLSKILATLGVSSTAKKPKDTDDDLSEDAKKVLKKLPELSFMRSKVLMFPVGQSSTIHH